MAHFRNSLPLLLRARGLRNMPAPTVVQATLYDCGTSLSFSASCLGQNCASLSQLANATCTQSGEMDSTTCSTATSEDDVQCSSSSDTISQFTAGINVDGTTEISTTLTVSGISYFQTIYLSNGTLTIAQNGKLHNTVWSSSSRRFRPLSINFLVIFTLLLSIFIGSVSAQYYFSSNMNLQPIWNGITANETIQSLLTSTAETVCADLLQNPADVSAQAGVTFLCINTAATALLSNISTNSAEEGDISLQEFPMVITVVQMFCARLADRLIVGGLFEICGQTGMQTESGTTTVASTSLSISAAGSTCTANCMDQKNTTYPARKVKRWGL